MGSAHARRYRHPKKGVGSAHARRSRHLTIPPINCMLLSRCPRGSLSPQALPEAAADNPTLEDGEHLLRKRAPPCRPAYPRTICHYPIAILVTRACSPRHGSKALLFDVLHVAKDLLALHAEEANGVVVDQDPAGDCVPTVCGERAYRALLLLRRSPEHWRAATMSLAPRASEPPKRSEGTRRVEATRVQCDTHAVQVNVAFGKQGLAS